MKYTSPQIVNHTRATYAVQSVGLSIKDPDQVVFDNPASRPETTPLAYEADE